ncbi:hypothetical protein OAO18_03825 [Francisellaceae bacterium]|nr:hypothetical protein [Francisellaceae bacterium]
MVVKKLIAFSGSLLVCGSLYASSAEPFSFKVFNDTGHDIMAMAADNGNNTVYGNCVKPSSVATPQKIDVPRNTPSAISYSFIRIYASNDGSCSMPNSKRSDVRAANIIQLDSRDLNDGSNQLHYWSFAPSGLSLTPIVVYNQQLDTLSTFIGYRPFDKKGKQNYANFIGGKLSPETADNGRNQYVYVEPNQTLEFH